MKLLFIGDVMGEPGLRAVRAHVSRLREHTPLDLVVANAENVAGGNGVTPDTAKALFDAGVDVLTNGNHAWDKREALEYIRSEPRLLRPYNYPDGTPGEGWFVATAASDQKVGILNLLGTTFMEPKLSCAFRTADQALARKPEDVKLVFVDMHAETTSEKMALAWYLDGRVSAVVGTHTHIPTADERILPKGTGYLTDVGMTGCYDSVIGLKVEQSLERFVKKLPARFEVAQGEGELCAALLDLDEATGRCRRVERVRLKESEISTTSLRRVV
ncbi:MAG TPA: TIGR00282 family metallophosphoesterase [Burkholderiales bacterium]|nr:TIGR00282 family metallophosphoesterase [Burkholderiales bacterium]